MIQQPAYSLGGRYIRMRDTGAVFPVHPEQLKLVKKDLADLVEWNGTQFFKVELGSLPKAEPVKISSAPEQQTPPPVVQRTFSPPGTAPSVETFAAPAATEPATPEVALEAARVAEEQAIATLQAATRKREELAQAAALAATTPLLVATTPALAPVAAPVQTMPPPVKSTSFAPVAPRVDLAMDPPPSE